MIHSGEVVSYLKMVPHKFISPVSWTDSMWHLGGCMVFRYSGKKNHSKRIKGRVKEKEVNSYLSYLTSLFTDIYTLTVLLKHLFYARGRMLCYCHLDDLLFHRASKGMLVEFCN